MSLENISVQEAVRNLEQMKRAIGKVEKTKYKNRLFASNRIGLLLQTGCILLVAPFLFLESYSAELTKQFLYSANNSVFRNTSLISLAGFLASLIAILYLVLMEGARKSNELLSDYVSRNFLALSFLTLLSDLFVKFVAVCLVLMAPRPEWIGPLLLVFTADYLLQGRLFTLPFMVTVLTAIFCVITAGYQFYIENPSLLPALAIFTVIISASLACTLFNIRKEQV